MPKAPDEMLVITKTYDLVLWTSRHVERFPRSQRFTLGDRLQIRLFDVLDHLLRAKYSSDRLDILREVNLELEQLRFQFRLAKDLKCLSVESYGFAARTINEVGQLLGGWMKSTSGAGRRKEGSHETNRKPVAGTDQLLKPAPRSGKGAARQADTGERGPLPF